MVLYGTEFLYSLRLFSLEIINEIFVASTRIRFKEYAAR